MEEDGWYAALSRRDASLDGLFFVAVRTTGIYCRPVCPARIPRRENTSFFRSAVLAQEAGYRPCLRCRPESAPDSPAWIGSLASVNRGLRLIDEGALVDGDVEALATRLGMTGRQLRRLFAQHVGASPLAVEQTRRVLLAKKLLHETALPVTEIAFAAGFGSVRRFNEAFLAMFGRAPSAFRRAGGLLDAAAPITVQLAYRPPIDAAAVAARGHAAGAPGCFTVELPLFGPEARAAFSPGPGHSFRVSLEKVPLGRIGAALAWLKREVLGSATLSGKPWGRAKSAGCQDGPPPEPRA
ncbi:MAG: methylphosphotriester-DNA--protein-cysteine methyltransferase family protein [Ramlibacter sp.]|nr:methylphosphotriester-DNA--protein-cysteine methyltransferase family protein [Ramlibacter sp.]